MDSDDIDALRNENRELKQKIKNLEHILSAKALAGKSKSRTVEYFLLALALGFIIVAAKPMISSAIESKFRETSTSLE
jgi:cell division septum initiation protein DivIVA